MPGTILCVDSDRSLCEIIAKALSGEGHRVLSAHDGERALDLLDSEEFDLLSRFGSLVWTPV